MDWEIAIGLHHVPDNLKFTFMNAEIIDRNPSKENGVMDSLYVTNPVFTIDINWSLCVFLFYFFFFVKSFLTGHGARSPW
jgi:hypothetical protein